MTGLERLRSATSFFIAGTMQGSRTGADMTDQGYRAKLRSMIRTARPGAEIRDPGELMATWLGPEAAEIRTAHAELMKSGLVLHDELVAPLIRLTDVFDRLVLLSGASDVCVAWLPDREASMGTAAEMWAAHVNGRCVVAVTEMRQNLAVLACSDIIVATIEELAGLLEPVGAGDVVRR